MSYEMSSALNESHCIALGARLGYLSGKHEMTFSRFQNAFVREFSLRLGETGCHDDDIAGFCEIHAAEQFHAISKFLSDKDDEGDTTVTLSDLALLDNLIDAFFGSDMLVSTLSNEILSLNDETVGFCVGLCSGVEMGNSLHATIN